MNRDILSEVSRLWLNEPISGHFGGRKHHAKCYESVFDDACCIMFWTIINEWKVSFLCLLSLTFVFVETFFLAIDHWFLFWEDPWGVATLGRTARLPVGQDKSHAWVNSPLTTREMIGSRSVYGKAPMRQSQQKPHCCLWK